MYAINWSHTHFLHVSAIFRQMAALAAARSVVAIKQS